MVMSGCRRNAEPVKKRLDVFIGRHAKRLDGFRPSVPCGMARVFRSGVEFYSFCACAEGEDVQ